MPAAFFFSQSNSDDGDDPVFSHKSLAVVAVFPGYTSDATNKVTVLNMVKIPLEPSPS